jgi:hypothetical protein
MECNLNYEGLFYSEGSVDSREEIPHPIHDMFADYCRFSFEQTS